MPQVSTRWPVPLPPKNDGWIRQRQTGHKRGFAGYPRATGMLHKKVSARHPLRQDDCPLLPPCLREKAVDINQNYQPRYIPRYARHNCALDVIVNRFKATEQDLSLLGLVFIKVMLIKRNRASNLWTVFYSQDHSVNFRFLAQGGTNVNSER